MEVYICRTKQCPMLTYTPWPIRSPSFLKAHRRKQLSFLRHSSCCLTAKEWPPRRSPRGSSCRKTPTPHSYIINDRQFYVWCAGDAITFPILHKTSAVIESPDPINGAKIHLIGTPEGAKQVEPSTAVVSWMPGTQSLANIRANFCNFTNFFSSVETAAQYVAQHPGLAIVPVDAVFQIGKLLWEREPIKSLIAELAQRQG